MDPGHQLEMTIHGMAVCAGIGGLELGVGRALGGGYRTVCHVEREAFAAAVLVARMEDKAVGAAPVWDDLTTFDGGPWRGKVDLITAGLPCQPYSVAGRGAADKDERALWPAFLRIVEAVEPSAVFFENVPRFLKYFGGAHARLRELGFECAPPLLLTASELGAPHIRKRLFILAAHPNRPIVWKQPGRRGGKGGQASPEPGDAGEVSTNPHGAGLEGWGLPGRERPNQRPAGPGGDPAPDPDRGRGEGEWRGWALDRERQALRHDADRCGDGCRICGSFWEAESPVLRVDDGTPSRVDELRVIGNAVVPDVAAFAFSYLIGCVPGVATPATSDWR